jgi:hypothetical protein
MRGGAKPGERRGGRKLGTPNIALKEAKVAIEELARQNGPAALTALANVAMKGSSESARVAAAIAILDRGYGRARQSVDLSGEMSLRSLTDAELDTRIAELLARIG